MLLCRTTLVARNCGMLGSHPRAPWMRWHLG